MRINLRLQHYKNCLITIRPFSEGQCDSPDDYDAQALNEDESLNHDYLVANANGMRFTKAIVAFSGLGKAELQIKDSATGSFVAKAVFFISSKFLNSN